MRVKRPTRLALCSLLALGCAANLALADRKGGDYHPLIDPANFQKAIDNPYFPLVPGTTLKYVEKLGKHTMENEITVTADVKLIMGVTCVVVHDVVKEKGILKEDTFDWYAQDKQGNVWYFGEDTKEIHPHNKVSTEGSWEAGVERNQPGIMMPGRPAPGEPYRQEYGPGHAEDMGQVIKVSESVTVPFGSFNDCVQTKEWSLLEAGHSKKWYCRGVGLVREEATDGQTAELISVTRP